MRKLFVLAAVLSTFATPRPAPADPLPIAPGWSAQQLAAGLATPLGEIAVDPVTRDAFVMDHASSAATVYRITLAGVRTVVASGVFDMNVLAFDPAARELYLATAGTLGRYSESGQPLGTLPGVAGALAIGPDGALYCAHPDRIQRFDSATQAWQDWRMLASFYLTYNSPDAMSFAPDGAVFLRSGATTLRANEGEVRPLGNSLVSMGLCATAHQLLVGPFALDPDGPASQGRGTPWLNVDDAVGRITGLATDPDGRIYLVAIGNAAGQGSVWVLSPPAAVPVRPATWGALKAAYR